MIDPPFRRVAVIGLGLIGGSVALRVRQTWPDVDVIGVDRVDVLATAEKRGAVTSAHQAIDEIDELQDPDLLVLAAPVAQIPALIEKIARARLRGLVTDVGSTKRRVMAAASARGLRFVGGHPVAGSAHAGIDYARPGLFEERQWLLVKGEAAEADAARVASFVRALGAVPRFVQADVHDREMAYVSHLPQLLASALMATAGNALGREGLTASGPGFADMTRLASSSADVWRGILASNADYLCEAVHALIAALPAADDTLADPSRIDTLFGDANKWSMRN